MPVEIAWSPFARARLQKIRAYMALDKPDAAVVEALRNHPYLGRAGAGPGIREFIGGTPYIVLYRVRGRRITISTIWHASQKK